MKTEFSFENLIVYKKALAWAQDADTLCRTLDSKASPVLLNQLTRAALSIPLNIAEGNGRWHKPDKRQFFWIARGSVFECVPILEILAQQGRISPESHQTFRHLLEQLGKLLTGLIKSVEKLETQ